MSSSLGMHLPRKSQNWGMGPNFDVSAPPTFVTGNSNKLESLNMIKLLVVDESVFVSHACLFC